VSVFFSFKILIQELHFLQKLANYYQDVQIEQLLRK